MSVPADLLYSAEHEWVRVDGGLAVVGVTAFAVDALGDVVFVDVAPIGTVLRAGERCGEIESTKAVSDLYAPVNGTVVAVNAGLVDAPEQLAADPYGAGWLLEIALDGAPGALLDASGYAALIDGA